MSLLADFYKYVSGNAKPLAVEVVESVVSALELDISDWEKEQGVLIFSELLHSMEEASLNEEESPVPANFLQWSNKNAAMQVAAGRNISEIVVRYPPTREAFTDIVSKVSAELQLSIKQCAFLTKQINTALDRSLNETIFSFEKISKQYKEETKKEMAELSAPVVPVKDGVVILPLVGEIDGYRANYLMETVLPRLAAQEVEHVIADFSGIWTLNEQVAAHLHQIGSMLQLMGIQVVCTGFRPELVKIIVDTRLDMSRIQSFSTVKEALEGIG